MLSIVIFLSRHTKAQPVVQEGLEAGYITPKEPDDGRWTWPILDVRYNTEKKQDCVFTRVDLPKFTALPILGIVLDLRDQLGRIIQEIFKTKIPLVPGQRVPNEHSLHELVDVLLQETLEASDKKKNEKRSQCFYVRRNGIFVVCNYDKNPLAIASVCSQPSQRQIENLTAAEGYVVTKREIKAGEELTWCRGQISKHSKASPECAKNDSFEVKQELIPVHEYVRSQRIDETTIRSISELRKWLGESYISKGKILKYPPRFRQITKDQWMQIQKERDADKETPFTPSPHPLKLPEDG